MGKNRHNETEIEKKKSKILNKRPKRTESQPLKLPHLI
jgi:hypothetical protein